MKLSPQVKTVIAVIWLIVALLALGYAASSHAPEIEWRCYTEPVIYQVDGYWVIECDSGNEVSLDHAQEAYPGPGDDPYPMPTDEPPACTRAWDGDPCYPSE